MKKDYRYILSSGVDASHLFNVQHFARLCDALDAASELHSVGKVFSVERFEDGHIVTDTKKHLAQLKEEKRKAYRKSKGYKYAAK